MVHERDQQEKRAKIMTDFQEAQSAAQQLDAELLTFRNCDPEVLEARGRYVMKE
jgi:hypothetical protein